MTTPDLFEQSIGRAPLAAKQSGAEISACGKYRYMLWRRWDLDRPRLVWVMLNPSTADAEADDPTIRKCIGFAKRLGFGGIRVLNLFAYRATSPAELRGVDDPVGPENNAYLERMSGIASLGEMTIAAWGAHPMATTRANKALSIICYDMGDVLHALRMTGDGQPCHPLYLPYELVPQRWMDRTIYLSSATSEIGSNEAAYRRFLDIEFQYRGHAEIRS